MKRRLSKTLATGISVAMCAGTSLPAAAASWTMPGVTAGVPAGTVPPPGLYFVGTFNYGVSNFSNNSVSPTTSAGNGGQIFIWVPGWTFLGASYAAAVSAGEDEHGFHNSGYIRGFTSPEINPVTLSWDLGNGFFGSVGEFIYLPITSQTVPSSSFTATSGTGFEQHAALSYVTSEWIASANFIFDITTPDKAGIRQPDSINLDLALLKQFGKWRLGPVAYGAWDVQTTPANNPLLGGAGKGAALGVGGYVGYDFGPVDLSVMLTHQVDTHGDTTWGKDDTRFWTTMVIPIWNPPAPAEKPVLAKY